jgi:hypothetical protein
MKTRIVPLAVLLTLTVSLCLAAAAAAAGATSFPSVSVAGAVGFVDQDIPSFASFAARAVGPAMPGEMHQPANGALAFANKAGVRFTASIEHIHGHGPNEVHFGGTITRASDPSLVGKFAHCVAIDGGSPGRTGDLFSVVVTPAGEHQHGVPVPVLVGDLFVKSPAM